MAIINGLFTILLMVIFIGIWIWAWSSKNRDTFNEMAHLPLNDSGSNGFDSNKSDSSSNDLKNDLKREGAK